MALDLPRVVARLSRRKRAIIFPAISPRAGLQSDLASIYMRVVRKWRNEAAENLLPIYAAALIHARPVGDGLTRDDLNELGAQFDASGDTIDRLVLSLGATLDDWAVRAETIHRNQFIASAKTAAGVDLKTLIGSEGVRSTVNAFYRANLNLISSVNADMRTRIGTIVFQGFQSRTPRREIARSIDEALGLGRSRSLLIASDQTTKLSARLDQERQQEIGIEEFIWVHSGKVHFRPEHKARDGLIFAWDNNDLDGDLPGVAINCGCKAKAYLSLGTTPVATEGDPNTDDAVLLKSKWISEAGLTTLDEIMAAAPETQDILAGAAKEAALLENATFVNPGFKSNVARIQEKIAAGRLPQGVTDIVRGGFKVSSPAQADAIIARLRKSFQIADEGWTATPAGYFDRKVLVRFKNGMIGELQFQLPSVWKAIAGKA